MKEILRLPDLTKVTHYRDILESEGIKTLVKNENLSVNEVMIPVFYPALCVVNDDDVERAVEILKGYESASDICPNKEVACPACGESNPATFGECWSCGSEMPKVE